MADFAQIRVSADYRCFPTWLADRDGFYTDVPPGRLAISAELVRDLTAWADEYQQTYVADDPAASGFACTADRDDFAVRGRDLARRLRTELGDSCTVRYFDRAINAYETL